MFKIAIIGYGKMGRLIEKGALGRNWQVSAIIDPEHFQNRIDGKEIKEAEVCIDFSHPEAVSENVKRCLELGKNVVIGTTGWGRDRERVKKWVLEADRGLIYAANFSLGVNIFQALAKKAARMLKGYDAACSEIHHKHKADAPSGTALALRQAMAEEREGKEIPISSLRVGDICGVHKIFFDAPFDSIVLTHRAKSREGFAAGALDAAEWIRDKKGFFTMGEMLECLI